MSTATDLVPGARVSWVAMGRFGWSEVRWVGTLQKLDGDIATVRIDVPQHGQDRVHDVEVKILKLRPLASA
jgi:hypothetical protein